MEIEYPTVDDVIKANKRAIELFRATKAERHKMLASKTKIETVVEQARKLDGNVKQKAALLLKELNQKHLFASANKRTSFLVATEFILKNEGMITLKKVKDVRFLIDIREGKKTLKDIERWLNE